MDRARPTFSIGVDYGTNSVRALVVDVDNGEEIATAVYDYKFGDHGVLVDAKDPNLARQNPIDYRDGFVACVSEAVGAAMRLKDFDVLQVGGLGVDTTGSTPLPVDEDGIPLGMADPNTPNGLAWLWKDHTAHAEAAEITHLAKESGEPYLDKCGGVYSSEWFWSKILRCSRVDPAVFSKAHSWMELSDYVPVLLTRVGSHRGVVRNVCAAGHKAMFSAQWGGLPSAAFLGKLAPELAQLRGRLYDEALTSDQVAGPLQNLYAEATGLPAGLPVAVGVMDAHAGAVASGVKPGTLVKIMGTSTCDIMVHPKTEPLADIPGLCGIVDGSVVPGMIGLEAGQSAVGDLFNWCVEQLAARGLGDAETHAVLTAEAAQLKPGESGLLALDWNNGNRTVLVDPLLSGLLVGQTLHTTVAEIYRALIEATAFGALKIIRRLEEYGVRVDEVVNCGGIAEKSPLTMQIYADVCNRPMKIARSGQACALGAAIFGSVAGGAHASVEEAQAAMTGVKDTVYKPDPRSAEVYARLYELYDDLHDAFGTRSGSANLYDVMKALIAIRTEARR